jgi:4-amino-4-deoxy-L-arabinose transferase-like glycosyltransferase
MNESLENSEMEKRSSMFKLPRWATTAALVLIIGFTTFVLERDEGEYAYSGQLMLQGIPPYKLAYNMKLPGTYAAYALIMTFFGQSARGIHFGLILVNGATIILTWLLGRRLFGDICGLVAATAFVVMSLSHTVMGLAAHATHFITFFAVAGALLLARGLDHRTRFLTFLSGLLFGLAFVMKQQGVFFPLFGGVILLWDEWKQGPRKVGP